MLITDMHCDSLTRVTAERGLKQRYNFSFDNPQLQFVAAFVDEKGDPAEVRRRTMHLLDVYIAERARLDLVPVYGCHDIDFALATDRSASIFSIEGGGGLRADRRRRRRGRRRFSQMDRRLCRPDARSRTRILEP